MRVLGLLLLSNPIPVKDALPRAILSIDFWMAEKVKRGLLTFYGADVGALQNARPKKGSKGKGVTRKTRKGRGRGVEESSKMLHSSLPTPLLQRAAAERLEMKDVRKKIPLSHICFKPTAAASPACAISSPPLPSLITD